MDTWQHNFLNIRKNCALTPSKAGVLLPLLELTELYHELL